ncbi:response regulator transcription factor [Saccharomonospora sp. NPDC046836]|uniref:response regulator transcription factor n=1 Tax=Saccharomonospora sp. NPDC046836 TaxID=3156921 RepID=UPI003402F2FC
MARLLLVEDDETIGHALQASLQRHDYHVTWVRGGRLALQEAGEQAFDLALIDLGLPDLDGIEVCRRLRESQAGCVLVILTARTEEMDVVVGLEAGADDYLAKPVRLAELHARIRAHLRRESGAQRGEHSMEYGRLRIDPAARRVCVSGHEIPLRAKEFDLLLRLAREPGVAVRRETLMADVWDAHWFGSTKTLDVHVAAVRRKLADAAPDGQIPEITTLRGYGYRLEPPDAGQPAPG